jgi:hypothetical protein
VAMRLPSLHLWLDAATAMPFCNQDSCKKTTAIT